ncbi:hypothetical protein [Vogesella oryzae]|uniref:hypothetical protein n=1 Tax=Vogesella oryzae TaxID=1735285 RepID=UPI001582DE6D|nr:hypothetical protein [Vogesella oryzae]
MSDSAKALLSHSLPAEESKAGQIAARASARFSLSNKFVFTTRQNVMFFALFEIVYIDTMHHDRDNPVLLRCSNCFLIVSPLFLLCRLGAGIKPRAFFLPVVRKSAISSTYLPVTAPAQAAQPALLPASAPNSLPHQAPMLRSNTRHAP